MRRLTIYIALTLSFSLALSALEIQLADGCGRNAQAAATILRDCLTDIPTADQLVIQLACNRQFAEEEWELRKEGPVLHLTAGQYGFTLAAANFLEQCDVLMLCPGDVEKDAANIPSKLNLHSVRTSFALRGVNYASRMDNGRFAALRFLNSQCDYPMAEENGTRELFGGPKFCHTFHLYFNPKGRDFREHPEWFAEIGGQRCAFVPGKRSKAQLCLSNAELRREFTARLRARIIADREKAAHQGTGAPFIYDISMNDSNLNSVCTCKACSALLAKHQGVHSAVMLDFVNEIAAALEPDYPELRFSTLAYYYNELPPTDGIRPRANVLIVLCDTASNYCQPIDSPVNQQFANKVKAWSEIAQNLRIWDYNINYNKPVELPYNSEDVYASDLQFFRAHNVTEMFSEHEEDVLADCRDYKFHLYTALMQNPDADVEFLKQRFARIAYGPAAPLFLEYRTLLRNSQEQHQTNLDWNAATIDYSNLDLATIARAQDLFDQGEKLLAEQPRRLRRWRFARLSLDRATLIHKGALMREYLQTHGNSLEGYPFSDLTAIAKRIQTVLATETPLRIPPKDRKRFEKEMADELAAMTIPLPEKVLQPAAKFAHLPRERVFEYAFDGATIHKNLAKFAPDATAEGGFALCLPIDGQNTTFEHHCFPMPFGIQDRGKGKNVWSCNLPATEVLPGYHWYHLGQVFLQGAKLRFFACGSWIVQQYLNDIFTRPGMDNACFDIYLNAKFTGPHFPGGKENEENAVWFSRLVLVKTVSDQPPAKVPPKRLD